MTSPKLRMLERQFNIQRQAAAPAMPTDDLTAAIAALVDQRVQAALAERPDTSRERALGEALQRATGTIEVLQRAALARPLEPPPAPPAPIRPLVVVSPKRERPPIPQTPMPTPIPVGTLPPATPRRMPPPAEVIMRRDGLGVLLGAEYRDANGNILFTASVTKRNVDGDLKEITYTASATDDREQLKVAAKIVQRDHWGNIAKVKYERVE